MGGQKKRLNTSKLLTLIKNSSDFSTINEYFSSVEDVPRLCHYLYKIMEAHKVNAKDVVQSSGLERSYFYHILSGKKNPSRNVVLRIAFCIGCDTKETDQLLRLAGYSPLYAQIRRDAAIIFCLENHYTMSEANHFLITQKEAPLYREA